MLESTSGISVLEMVGRIYDAALEPELWKNVLEGFSSNLGASTGLMSFQDFTVRNSSFMVSHEREDSFMESYRDHFISLNPYLPILSEIPDMVFATHKLIPEESLSSFEFYNDWLLPQNIHYHAGVIIFRDDSRVAMVTCQRRKSEGFFTEHDLEYFRIFEPHLQRAIQMNQKFWEHLASPGAAVTVLENIEMGVILIDEERRPVFVNRHARFLTSERKGLILRSNGVTAENYEYARHLEKMISEAVDTGMGRGMGAGGSFSLGIRPDEPLYAQVTPIRADKNDLGITGKRVCAGIFLSAPDLSRAVKPESLMDMFGLTQAEANLVGELANGQSLGEISENFGISIHTARDQLQSAFSKTDTRRQAELTQLVLSTPSSLIGDKILAGPTVGGPLNRRSVSDRRKLARSGHEIG